MIFKNLHTFLDKGGQKRCTIELLFAQIGSHLFTTQMSVFINTYTASAIRAPDCLR